MLRRRPVVLAPPRPRKQAQLVVPAANAMALSPTGCFLGGKAGGDVTRPVCYHIPGGGGRMLQLA